MSLLSTVLVNTSGGSVTVPSGAQGVVVLWYGSGNGATTTLSSMSLTDAGAFTFDVNLNDDSPAFHYVGVAHALITATGSKTFTYAFSATATEGPVLALFFVDEIDTGDWIRDSDGARTATTTAISLTVDSAATDIVVSLDGRAVATAPSAVSGWTSQGSGTFNGIGYRAASADSPGSTTTTFNAADENYSGAAVVSIKQTAGGGTVNEPKTLSRRNRPGRGPYSKGKYLRPSIAAYTPLPVFAAIASDSISLSDSAVAQTELIAAAADTVALSDSSVASVTAVASASDTLTLTDSAEGLVGFTADAADTLTLSDSALADASKTANAADSIALSDSSLADVSKVAAASDTLSLTDSALADAIKTVAAADSITLSDSAVAEIAAEVAGLFASLSRSNRPGRGPYSLGRYFRTGVDAFTAPPPDLSAVASDAISLNDSALADTIKTAAASDSLSLSDSALADAVKIASATDSIALSDGAEGIVGFPAEALDTLALSDIASANVVKEAAANDAVSLNDNATAVTVRVAAGVDSIVLSDSAVADGIRLADAVDTLTLSDSAVGIIATPGAFKTYLVPAHIRSYTVGAHIRSYLVP